MKTIDVGTDFYPRLANRDKFQGDGLHTAIEFRDKYLSEFYLPEQWTKGTHQIELDFSNVETLIPSFANETFAFFTTFAKPEDILKRIRLINISKVKLAIVNEELDSGYNR